MPVCAGSIAALETSSTDYICLLSSISVVSEIETAPRELKRTDMTKKTFFIAGELRLQRKLVGHRDQAGYPQRAPGVA